MADKNRTSVAKAFWFIGAWVCFGIGVIGVALPGIPTTGPMILALACFSRSSTRFHDWLYQHPRFGPPLRRWHTHRIIPARAKIAALSMMTFSLTYLLWTSPMPKPALAAVVAFIGVGAVFVLRCPHRSPVSPDARS